VAKIMHNSQREKGAFGEKRGWGGSECEEKAFWLGMGKKYGRNYGHHRFSGNH
jgi:hypothetical protein